MLCSSGDWSIRSDLKQKKRYLWVPHAPFISMHSTMTDRDIRPAVGQFKSGVQLRGVGGHGHVLTGPRRDFWPLRWWCGTRRERELIRSCRTCAHMAVLWCDINAIIMICECCVCVYVDRWVLCSLSCSTESSSWREKNWGTPTSVGRLSAAQSHSSETHTHTAEKIMIIKHQKGVIHPRINPVIYSIHMLFFLSIEDKMKI